MDWKDFSILAQDWLAGPVGNRSAHLPFNIGKGVNSLPLLLVLVSRGHALGRNNRDLTFFFLVIPPGP